jgi:hypothetical protein
MLGDTAWCEGHREEADAALTWARNLPDDWATTVITWWIATGEIDDSDGNATSSRG